MRWTVILAGGSGTRLWPMSHHDRPKQVLPLGRSGRPLISDAIDIGKRLGDRVLIVASEELTEAMRRHLFVGTLDFSTIGVETIIEPAARNTAAAIALAGETIYARDSNASIAVLPADHHVREPEALVIALDACLTAAEKKGSIALVGIKPTRPETGYGYLEISGEGPVRPVRRFVEKPDRATARRFVTGGRHLWNAGIFCLSVGRLRQEIAARLPSHQAAVSSLVAGEAGGRDRYATLPSVSFDTGVMERVVVRVVAVPCDCGWSDVGSWAALAEVGSQDLDGNFRISGEAIAVDADYNIVATDEGSIIALVGVSNLVVVKAGNAVLVMPRDQAQRVREVVAELDKRGLRKFR